VEVEDEQMVRATPGRDTQPCISIERREVNPARLVEDRMRWSGYPFLWKVRCELREGVLLLTGTVPTLRLKQIAQEIASHTAGVRLIENRVQVTSSLFLDGRSAAAG
jgi:osmotically-inducible protein OsmY